MPCNPFRLVFSFLIASAATVGMGLTWWETGSEVKFAILPTLLAAAAGMSIALVGLYTVYRKLPTTLRLGSYQLERHILFMLLGAPPFVLIAEFYEVLSAMSFLVGYLFIAMYRLVFHEEPEKGLEE